MAIDKQQIKEVMSEMAKRSHKKSPRTREYFQKIARKRWGNRIIKTKITKLKLCTNNTQK